MITPTREQVEKGQHFMSCLFDASVRKSMHGLGGCKEFDWSDFPLEYHDLIRRYMNDEICSVEATYILMRNMEKAE